MFRRGTEIGNQMRIHVGVAQRPTISLTRKFTGLREHVFSLTNEGFIQKEENTKNVTRRAEKLFRLGHIDVWTPCSVTHQQHSTKHAEIINKRRFAFLRQTQLSRKLSCVNLR